MKSCLSLLDCTVDGAARLLADTSSGAATREDFRTGLPEAMVVEGPRKREVDKGGRTSEMVSSGHR